MLLRIVQNPFSFESSEMCQGQMPDLSLTTKTLNPLPTVAFSQLSPLSIHILRNSLIDPFPPQC